MEFGNFNNGYTTIGGREASRTKYTPAVKFYRKGSLNNHLLASQSETGFARLLPYMEDVSFSNGEYLYQFHQRNDYVYFPETAVISHLHNLADGRTIEIAMIGIEGASGLCSVFSPQPPTHCAQATVGGNAMRIKTEVLRQEFARGEKLQSLMLDYINSHINQISQRIVCESFHLIEERLCSWLLMLYERVQKNHWQITHEQISLLLGANRPSITHAARTLRKKGFIDYTRGKFYILNSQGLKSGACECYSALQKIH